tara:strand:- start:76 stop:264 length:189 start_codon:yes stop_codon:yes gene_type:complete
MKKNTNECYNNLFEKINSIENRIKNIRHNLSILRNMLDENTKRKTNAQQNCTTLNSEESPND